MTSSAQLLFIGLGWFPTTPGGMERYGYELMQQLVREGDRITLCGVGLPEASSHDAITLTNLADPKAPFPNGCGASINASASSDRKCPARMQSIFTLRSIVFLCCKISPPECPLPSPFMGPGH